jgi:hypothetical protein
MFFRTDGGKESKTRQKFKKYTIGSKLSLWSQTCVIGVTSELLFQLRVSLRLIYIVGAVVDRENWFLCTVYNMTHSNRVIWSGKQVLKSLYTCILAQHTTL